MPLKKSGTNGATAEAAPTQTPAVAAQATVPAAAPKAAPKQLAPKVTKSLDKESYWERKEERDIETGKRIRRSGVWQAALQSMAPLQFNSAGTLESYLALVDKIAEEGLKFVQRD